MKKFLFLLLAVAAMANIRVNAQTYYSDSIGEVRIDDDFTLVYKYSGKILFGAPDRYIYLYKKSQLVPMRNIPSKLPSHVGRAWGTGVQGGLAPLFTDALRECFLPRQYLNADTMECIEITILYHNTTGAIVGMYFVIPDLPDFNTIPPAAYAKLHRYFMEHTKMIPDYRPGRYATSIWEFYLNFDKNDRIYRAFDDMFDRKMRGEDIPYGSSEDDL